MIEGAGDVDHDQDQKANAAGLDIELEALRAQLKSAQIEANCW